MKWKFSTSDYVLPKKRRIKSGAISKLQCWRSSWLAMWAISWTHASLKKTFKPLSRGRFGIKLENVQTFPIVQKRNRSVPSWRKVFPPDNIFYEPIILLKFVFVCPSPCQKWEINRRVKSRPAGLRFDANCSHPTKLFSSTNLHCFLLDNFFDMFKISLFFLDR